MSPGLTEERAEVCKGCDLMCMAQFDSNFQQDFYKLFSFAVLWQIPWTLQEADLSQSCMLLDILH